MRVSQLRPTPGEVLEWDLDDMFTTTSGDMPSYERTTYVCTECGESESSYNNTFHLASENPCTQGEYGFHRVWVSVNRLTNRPELLQLKWEHMLAQKRMDWQYEDLYASIALDGFTQPLAGIIKWGKPQLVNGHHRVAVAAALGMKSVPVKFYDNIYSVDWGD